MIELPEGFVSESANVKDFRMHYIKGGQGDPIVIVHGAWDSWWAWRHVVPPLAANHTVIIVAPRGLALSGKPLGGYDGNTLGDDVYQLITSLGYQRFALVGHDWGGHVAYTLAAQHPEAVTSLTIFEWAIPGTGFLEAWMEPKPRGNYLWHMGLQSVPDIGEMLIENSLRPFMQYFFNNYSAVRGAIDEESLNHYVSLYQQPGAIRALMAIYQEFWTDAEQSAELRKTPLTMPVQGWGGDMVYGDSTMNSLAMAAGNVTGGTIPMCGHWVAEEQPSFVAARILEFVDA